MNREKVLNWTYAQIARAVGVDRAAVARLFERDALSPDFVTVWKIAKLYDVEVDEIVDPAWFYDSAVITPRAVELLTELKTPPRETLKSDGPPEIRKQLAMLTRELEEERARLGIPDPAAAGSHAEE